MLLLLLSCFSCVQLCATPEAVAHQAALSLGSSRQEHWSGLPFPSPMHESEKWKWSRSVVFETKSKISLRYACTCLLCVNDDCVRACVLSHFSCIQLFATLWAVAHQPPLSMGILRQDYWSGWPCPPPEDLPDPGTEPASLMSSALAVGFFTTSATGEGITCLMEHKMLLQSYLSGLKS